jgi:hypothetical protein
MARISARILMGKRLLSLSAFADIVPGIACTLVISHTKVNDEFRAKKHAAVSQFQYLTDHIRFIAYQGKQILLIDLSNCASAEVETIFRAVPNIVTTRPRGSVLILSDFGGASIDQEAIRIMKETAVFDKPYVKKSAWTGVEDMPEGAFENLSGFSRREFSVFQTREKALAWLAND